MNTLTSLATRATLVVLLNSLAACGGGSSLAPGVSADPPATPPPPAADAPALALTLQSAKTFRFTWADVTGETEYRLLEDPDGTSGYTSLTPQPLPADTTAHEHTVFLPARVNARYILQACKSGTCLDSAPVSVAGNLAQAIGFLKSDVSTADDEFGYSVALSSDGGTLAVGAPGESSAVTGIATQEPPSANDMPNSGAVYVFARQGQRWQQQAFVKASTSTMTDRFGESLALSVTGDALAVGAPDSDSMGFSRGSAHVFMLGGMGWQEQAELKAPHATIDLQFGTSVALSADGSTLAVGARGDASAAKGVDGDPQDDSASLAGAVHVFSRDGVNWPYQAYLKASNTDMDDNFGRAVSLSANGDTLVIGAPFERSTADGINGNQDSNGSSGVGAAYVFKRHGLAWSQRAYVKAPNSGGDDRFGGGLALSADGQTLAIGATGEASSASGWNGAHDSNNDQPGAGAVYLY